MSPAAGALPPVPCRFPPLLVRLGEGLVLEEKVVSNMPKMSMAIQEVVVP
jgi:hypothetical protein